MKGYRRRRRIKLGPFEPCLTRRREETGGQITGRALHAEITVWGSPAPTACCPNGSGRTCSRRTVRHRLHRLRPSGRSPADRPAVRQFWPTAPSLTDATARLVASFAGMLTLLEGERLTDWITEAMTSSPTGISTFALGLNSDYSAVHSGLTTHWKSSPVEGAVNRIKVFNWQVSGRAGLPFPRKRFPLA